MVVVLLGLLSGIDPIKCGAPEGSVSGRATTLFGEPLNAVVVELSSLNTTDRRVSRTDARGEYRFDGLVEGEYRLVASLPGFTKRERVARVLEGITTSRVDFGLRVGDLTELDRVELRGTVRARDGQPVEGAIVVVIAALDRTESQQTTTDATGRFYMVTPITGQCLASDLQ